MLPKNFRIEVIFICILTLIPWPPHTKLQCSRDSSRIVRKIVQTKLTPIFQKYKIEIPIECPFHQNRDLFLPQENAKIRNRPTQFTCGFCGKSFYEEKFLDLHFDNRHKKHVNHAEDSICLADYCDILRCDVLITKEDSLLGGTLNSPVSTDIELYNEATALAAARREVIKSHMSSNTFRLPPTLKEKLNDLLAATGHKIEVPAKEKIHKRRRNVCNENARKTKSSSFETNSNNTDEKENSTIGCESIGKSRFSEIQRLKANCKSEEMQKLKSRCELLVRTCIAGAFFKLSSEDFKNMENELNKAICWYLTCERYWEDTATSRPFPFALVFILVVVLSLGICLCYYIIWILFDTDESTLSSSSYNYLSSTSSYPTYQQQQQFQHHHQQPLQSSSTVIGMHNSNLITSSLSMPHDISSQIYVPSTSSNAAMIQSQSSQPLDLYSDEFANLDEHEQYIYVHTYPSEMKKRLSDSFRSSRI
ncbi:hypothetical protein PVAND_012717 [Polypedilum vanderplanki]|uniref:C2H2-type domain-containing protein n=1 Tax=Polypedilum vanderplanki TaxID=319348 RepID=A0A9J6CND9_POLVA|nr:hypothetical protein PVAND_012717 [Polypedilum vanderplanki]